MMMPGSEKGFRHVPSVLASIPVSPTSNSRTHRDWVSFRARSPRKSPRGASPSLAAGVFVVCGCLSVLLFRVTLGLTCIRAWRGNKQVSGRLCCHGVAARDDVLLLGPHQVLLYTQIK